MAREMKVPFGTVSISEKSKALISQILDTRRVSSGKYVRMFEERFAKVLGAKEAVAVSSGTDANALAMAVLYDFGARRGDEVIVPALSFAATGNAVLQAGFTPVFVDIELETLNIDVSCIEEAITEKTRAIMPVHLMGKLADMDGINGIAKRRGLYVIEDASEAHGATYKGKAAGTLADLGAFSLYVAHMITSVEGGVVITDKEEFSDILRSLRSHGRACKCKLCVLNVSPDYCPKRFENGTGRDIRFVFERIGYSSKMNEMEAAVGLGSIELFPEILEKRRRNLLHVLSRFDRFRPYLETISEKPEERIGPHAIPIIVQKAASFTRDELAGYMESNGIETRTLFASMPTQCTGFSFLDYREGEFPNAEYIGNHGLHVGVHQDLGLEEMDYILATIERFLEIHQR